MDLNSPVDFSEWQKYRSKKLRDQITQPVTAEIKESSPQGGVDLSEWQRFKSTKKEVQNPERSSVPRHIVRSGSRLLESVLGAPGDIVQGLSQGVPSFAEWATGREQPNVRESSQKAGKFLSFLPTSENIREQLKETSQGATEPQGKTEELADEALALAPFVPSKAPTVVGKWLRSLGKSVAAVGAKEATKAAGGGPGYQTAAELGTLFFFGAKDYKTAQKYAGELFEEAEKTIPQGTVVPAERFLYEADKLEKSFSKGVSTPGKDAILKPLKEIRNKSAGGAVEFDELLEGYRNINEILNSKKLFDELSTTERKIARYRFDQLRDIIRNEITDYGSHNPEFLNKWRSANEAYATIEKSKKVSNFIGNYVKNVPEKLGAVLLAEILFGAPHLAAYTAAGTGLVKAGELGYRIAKSPILQKHYGNAVKYAIQENGPRMLKSLEELDKGIRKDQNNKSIL